MLATNWTREAMGRLTALDFSRTYIKHGYDGTGAIALHRPGFGPSSAIGVGARGSGGAGGGGGENVSGSPFEIRCKTVEGRGRAPWEGGDLCSVGAARVALGIAMRRTAWVAVGGGGVAAPHREVRASARAAAADASLGSAPRAVALETASHAPPVAPAGPRGR